MGEVSFIETSEVPASGRGGRNGARALLAEETLRRAMREMKSVRVVLGPDERATTVAGAYHKAAKQIGISLIVTAGSKRVYTNERGGEAREASVLYFTFTKKQTTPTNGYTRPPVSPGEAQRVFAHGVEVSR